MHVTKRTCYKFATDLQQVDKALNIEKFSGKSGPILKYVIRLYLGAIHILHSFNRINSRVGGEIFRFHNSPRKVLVFESRSVAFRFNTIINC